MQDLTEEILAPYLKVEDERSIKAANEFTKEVLDHYLVGDHITGVTLPWGNLQSKFRLRNGECTIVGGITSIRQENPSSVARYS